jgi:hypothetical protein
MDEGSKRVERDQAYGANHGHVTDAFPAMVRIDVCETDTMRVRIAGPEKARRADPV